jgi:hypothetical protein
LIEINDGGAAQAAPAAWRCSPQIHRDQVRRSFFLSKSSHATFDIIPSVLLQRSPNLKGPPSGGLLFSDQDLSNRSGNLAIFSAIRRASSLLSSLAAALCS